MRKYKMVASENIIYLLYWCVVRNTWAGVVASACPSCVGKARNFSLNIVNNLKWSEENAR